MTNFPVHTIESAPERSKPALQQLQSAFGMIPNIVGAMSTSPVLINSLVGLFGNVHGGSFTEAQVQIVLLTDAVTNACTWAVAFHTTLALKEGIDPADVQAIREGRLPKDSKLAALSALAKTMIEKRGRLDDEDVDRFLAAGFGKDHAPRGDRGGRRVHDHELHRQHHEAFSRSAVSGSRLGRLSASRSRRRDAKTRKCASPLSSWRSQPEGATRRGASATIVAMLFRQRLSYTRSRSQRRPAAVNDLDHRFLETSRWQPLAPAVRNVGVPSAGYDSSFGGASRGRVDFRFARILNGRNLGAKAPKAAALIRDHPPSKNRSGCALGKPLLLKIVSHAGPPTPIRIPC